MNLIPYSSPRPTFPLVIVLPPLTKTPTRPGDPTQPSRPIHPQIAAVKKENPISIRRETFKAAGIDMGKLLIAASLVSGAGLAFHSFDQKVLGNFFYSLSQKFNDRQQLSEKLWELKWIPALGAVTKLSDAVLSLPVKMIETGRLNPYAPIPEGKGI